MLNKSEAVEIELISIIVNFGLGSKIVKSAKKLGVSGGTVTVGRGTINNNIWDFMGLSDIRKEIIYMVAEKETAYKALEDMNREFKFCKANHGIAFTTSICDVLGKKSILFGNIKNERGVDNTMYHSITIIVDKGKGEEVIEAATKAGSKGGTIINARGSGIHETSKVFSMEIEPEKEVVIILSEIEKTDTIVESIRRELKIDEPGNGIIYVQNVNKAYGIYK